MKERELVINMCEHQTTGRGVIITWLNNVGDLSSARFDSYKCAEAWLAGFTRGREDGYSWTYKNLLESQRWDVLRMLPAHVQKEIYYLLNAQQPISAIKRYRENTSCSLLEAKNAIDLLRLMMS